MSLLERDLEHRDARQKKEITAEQISRGINSIRGLFDKDFELEPCEMTALYGYINYTEPVDSGDAELRWDIVAAGYRQQQGVPVNERHLGLYVIRKMLLDVELVSIETPTV
jgi:hypothetical protein